MAGAVLSQPQAFEYYPMPAHQQAKQDLANFSPTSLYSPQADFSGDSAASPDSPTSPVFANSYHLPPGNDWINWEDEKSTDFFKTEPYDPDLVAPPRTLTESPGVNPLDLSNPLSADDVPFGQEGLSDNQPLFQNPHVLRAEEARSPRKADMSGAYVTQPATRPLPSVSQQVSDSATSRYPNRKRKSSPNASPGSHSTHSSPSPPPSQRRAVSGAPKKTAHNMIEKRYRTNLNDKIAALRDSVPSLRVMVHKLEASQNGGGGSSEEADGEDMMWEEDLGGLAPAHKLNKATILSKATEYITHLERKNRNLAKENAALRTRVEGFEMLVLSRGGTDGLWS